MRANLSPRPDRAAAPAAGPHPPGGAPAGGPVAARHRRIGALAVALPALAGTVAVLAVARRGAYASPDSTFYVGVARALRDDMELVVPATSQPLGHFPPLFPVVLAAAAALLRADPLDAAEVLNPLLHGATALVAGFAVRRRTGSAGWGAAAAAAVVTPRDLIGFAASAPSEPLFTLLVLGGLLALAESIARRSNRLLVLAGALAGLACLTRYTGVALIPSGAGALLWLESRRAERRPGRWRAAAFAGLAAAPVAVWLLTAGGSNRQVVFHMSDARYWSRGLDSVSRWVLPAPVPFPVRLAALVAVAAAGWRLARRPGPAALPALPEPGRDPFPLLVAWFSAAYLGLLVAHRLLLDDSGRLDDRFLGPVHVLALVALLPAVRRAAAGWAGTRARPVLAAAGLGLLALHMAHAASWTVDGLDDDTVGRRGLTARAWRESPVLAAVAALPPSVPVYTNAPDAVFMLTGRAAAPLPAHRDLLTGRPVPGYAAGMEAMVRDLRERDGVVAWFSPYAFRDRYLAGPAALARRVPLATVGADEVGALYRPAPPA